MSEAQSAEERCGNGHRVDKHDDTDDKSGHCRRVLMDRKVTGAVMMVSLMRERVLWNGEEEE
jgi:hypothetical protein